MNKFVRALPLNLRRPFLDLLLITGGVLLALISLQLTALANTSGNQGLKPAIKSDPIEEKWGIRIESIRLTAHGYMVDFRYRILDTQKAEALFVRKTKPYLIDQASEKVLTVPHTAKVGPLRTSNKPQQGRIYWMFFSNRGRLVRAGSKVTVVIGDFRAENLVVE